MSTPSTTPRIISPEQQFINFIFASDTNEIKRFVTRRVVNVNNKALVNNGLGARELCPLEVAATLEDDNILKILMLAGAADDLRQGSVSGENFSRAVGKITNKINALNNLDGLTQDELDREQDGIARNLYALFGFAIVMNGTNPEFPEFLRSNVVEDLVVRSCDKNTLELLFHNLPANCEEKNRIPGILDNKFPYHLDRLNEQGRDQTLFNRVQDDVSNTRILLFSGSSTHTHGNGR